MTAPTARSEVLAVRYAGRELLRSEFFLNFRHYDEPDAPLTMDYFVWVVRTAGQTVLVDTGYNPRSAARRGRRLDRSPVDALASAGVPAESVDRVVVTHCHFDHVGNLGAFPRADVVIAADEHTFWRGPTARRNQFGAWADPEDLAVLDELDKAGRLHLVDQRATVAPGVDVVVVGGHTPGQAIVTVDSGTGRVVLASDAVHTYEEIELDRPFSLAADVVGMLHAYDRIRDLLTHPNAVLVPGHDPLVMNRFERLDAAPGLGVTVMPS